jgi:hypothetical protein
MSQPLARCGTERLSADHAGAWQVTIANQSAGVRSMDTIEAQRRRVAKVLTRSSRDSFNRYYNKQIQQQPVENRQELEKLNSTQARINAKARELDILTDLHAASGEAVIYQRFGQAKRADASMKKAKAIYPQLARLSDGYYGLKKQVAGEYRKALQAVEGAATVDSGS